MDNRVICDTSVISDFFEGKTDIIQKMNEIGGNNIAITTIVYIELIRWLSLYRVSKSKRAKILRGIRNFTLLKINETIADKAIEISNEDNSLDAPDILIGATALYYKIPIYTLNVKHFKRMKDIKIYS